MFSSRTSKVSIVALLVLLTGFILAQFGVHQTLLKWGLQAYLGEVSHGRVLIEDLRGGFFSGITLKNIAFYQRSVATPLVIVEEVTTDFRILGGFPRAKHCVLSRPQIFLEECVDSIGDFSLPLEHPLVFLPRSGFWRKASFAIVGGRILQSVNRQDNTLLNDLTGSIVPTKNQVLEFVMGTAKASSEKNRLQVYGTFQTSKNFLNLEFDLELSNLENLNLFLRSLHVLKGSARLEGKIRSGILESVELDFHDAELFFPMDKRVIKNLEGKISLNEQFVSLRECKGQGEGMRMEFSGDAQRLSFKHGQIDISNLLAKVRIVSDTLSRQPLDLDVQTSAKIFYRHHETIARLQWNKELVESLSLMEGKLRVNKIMDLEYQAKYAPGLPFALDFKVTSLDFDRIKKGWFGDRLGSLFHDVRILGDGRAQCQWDSVILTGRMDWDDNEIPYRFLWAKRQLKVEDFHISESTTLLGNLDLDKGENSALVFHFQNESITRLLHVLGPDKKVSLTGKFTGRLEFRGDLLDPAIQGSLDLRNGTLKGVPFKEGQIGLTGKFPKIYLDRSVIFLKKDMPVAITGFIDLSLTDVFKNINLDRTAANSLGAS